MKNRQKLVTDELWELIEPLLPEPRRRKDHRGRPWASNRSLFRGHSVDSADRSGVAVSTRRVSLACDLLAETEAVAGRRRMARCVARTVGRSGRRGSAEVGRDVPRGQLRPGEKRAMRSAKPSAARERSGWYWSTVKVFRWEFGWKVPLRQKLRLRKPRSNKSASHVRKAGHGKSRGA